MFRYQWGCDQIEMTQPLYRQVPVFLHSAIPGTHKSYQIDNLIGNCFKDIGVKFSFQQTNESELHADIELKLNQSKDWTCLEQLQFSTAFTDKIEVFSSSGTKRLSYSFFDPDEVAFIIKSGLGLFTYCTDPFEILSSTLTTIMMWVGGNGKSKYLPIIGNRPTSYQKEQN